LRDHALYTAFAPADNPQIALALVVENAGFGAAQAAPIARRVFDYVLLGHYPNEEDLQAVKAGQAAAPMGKPREVANVNVLGVTELRPGVPGVAPASLFTPSGAPQARPKAPGVPLASPATPASPAVSPTR
jgi:penicillin-binding protein 2